MIKEGSLIRIIHPSSIFYNHYGVVERIESDLYLIRIIYIYHFEGISLCLHKNRWHSFKKLEEII